ncbi:hypothetical protein FOZ63_027460, partial [Perkinsus olseni]
ITPSSWESVSLVMGDDVDNTIGNSIAYRDTIASSSSPALLPPSRRSRGKVMDSSHSSSSLYERHGAWMMKREQRLEERRREKEDDSMRECNFKPRTTAQRRGTQTRIGPQQYGKLICLRVLLFPKLFVVCRDGCVKEWEQRRKEREKAAEEAREEKEIAACTFAPDIGKSQRMRQGSSRLFEAARQQGSSSSSPPQRGLSDFTPATNTVRRSMRHARKYMETNVFDRLASHGRRRVSRGRGYGMPSRKAETRLSEVQMQSIVHSFLTRQNEREARRQEKLGMLEREVRADCTHEPKICDRSRRVSVPKVTERIRSKHSESREGMLRELEISRPFVPVVTAKARRARSRTVVEMSYDDMNRRRDSIARLARTLKDRKEAEEEERRRSVNSIVRVPDGPLNEIPSRLRLDVERGSDYLRRVAEERERRAEAQRLRQMEIEAEELAQCTFRPSINKAPLNDGGRERLSVMTGVKRTPLPSRLAQLLIFPPLSGMPIKNHLGHQVLSPITDKEDFEKACKKNIYHMLMYSGLQGICQAIAQMGIFDAYLYVMAGDSNKAVGWAESISGLSQVMVAIPAGILVDKFSRALICRWCGWASLLMVALSIYGIYYDNMIVICFALAVAGGYFATQNCATYSLFADSIPQGHRAKWLTRASVVNQLASGVGPFIGLFLFVYFGNEWRLSVLHAVLIIGFLGFVPANVFLFGWTDVTHEDGLGGSSGRPGAGHVYRKTASKWTWTIPYLMCANDFITCIGAGMTVKFFPLFFKNDYNFTPTQVQLLWAFYGLTFGLFTWFCDKMANHIGRVQAGILFSAMGVICLFCLAWVRWLPAVVFTFLVRGAVQNAIYP